MNSKELLQNPYIQIFIGPFVTVFLSNIVKFIQKKCDVYNYDKLYGKRLTFKAIILNDFSKQHISCLKSHGHMINSECYESETMQVLEKKNYISGGKLTKEGEKLFKKT